MHACAPRRLTPAQVLLGLFVLGQVLFLPASNLLGLLRWANPAVVDDRPALRAVADVTSRWGLMTGQVQNWRLFAPNVPTQAIFVAVELRWEECPADGRCGACPSRVRLPSSFEPAHLRRYFRPPGSRDRLFHYENRLGWALVAWDREAVSQRPDEWRQYLADDVRRQWPAIRAYLRWRLNQFRGEHPDLPPPQEAVLLGRLYPTPPPEQLPVTRPEPIELPLARWRPAADGLDDRLPVEAYDSTGGRFTRLTIEEP